MSAAIIRTLANDALWISRFPIPNIGRVDAVTPRAIQCRSNTCEKFCVDRSQPWSEKCSWKDCCACAQCPGEWMRALVIKWLSESSEHLFSCECGYKTPECSRFLASPGRFGLDTPSIYKENKQYLPHSDSIFYSVLTCIMMAAPATVADKWKHFDECLNSCKRCDLNLYMPFSIPNIRRFSDTATRRRGMQNKSMQTILCN